jgi:hypothetical protein
MLSVQKGRALWVSAFPVLLDWRNVKSAEEVKFNFLWQFDDTDLQSTIHASPSASESKHKTFRLRQLPDPAYKRDVRGSSCVVLTQTAAYIVETHARWIQRIGFVEITFQGASRGAYGPKTDESFAFRTVRCLDWGRSALSRFDKPRYRAEVEAFNLPPVRETIYASEDYFFRSDWMQTFFCRVMEVDAAEEQVSGPDDDLRFGHSISAYGYYG